MGIVLFLLILNFVHNSCHPQGGLWLHIGVTGIPLAIYLKESPTAHQTPLMVSKQHEEQSCLPSLRLHFFFSAAVSKPTKEQTKEKSVTKCCLQVNYTEHSPIIQLNLLRLQYLSSCKFVRFDISSSIYLNIIFILYVENRLLALKEDEPLNRFPEQFWQQRSIHNCLLYLSSRNMRTHGIQD